MRDIPKTIKVGGHVFDIKFDDVDKSGYDGMGESHHWTNFFRIQNKLAHTKKWSTLIHEVIHEVNKQNGLQLTETQVHSLGEGIFQVAFDAGWLKKSKGKRK